MGDFLTSVTAWLALALYAAAQLQRRHRLTNTDRTGLWPLTVGLLFYGAHVLVAFELHYDWSHAVAYAGTAARVEAVLGWGYEDALGNGLFASYLFGFVWVVDVCWWIYAAESYSRRPRWLELSVRSFFLLMIVNGAVIFVESPQRWLGVAIVGVLLLAWRPAPRHRGTVP